MKTIHYLSIIILSFSSQILLAQNDTLVGVLRDISDKIIKRYPVTLGSQNPITVKTNKHGVFTIPGANLNDTLFGAPSFLFIGPSASVAQTAMFCDLGRIGCPAVGQ